MTVMRLRRATEPRRGACSETAHVWGSLGWARQKRVVDRSIWVVAPNSREDVVVWISELERDSRLVIMMTALNWVEKAPLNSEMQVDEVRLTNSLRLACC